MPLVSVSYDRVQCFHGVNTGSNPVGDAKSLSNLLGLEVLARYGGPPSKRSRPKNSTDRRNKKDDEFEGDEQAQTPLKGHVTAPFGWHLTRSKIALEISFCLSTR